MAATVIINRMVGENATITACDITSGSLHAGTEDSNTSPCNIPVPASGSNYSYWMTTQLECTAAPDTSLTNIRWYSDGTNSLGTGVQCVVAQASSYASALGTAGSSGQVLDTTNHPGITAAPSIFVTYTSDAASKLVVAGSIAAATGSFGNRVVLQLQVDDTAGAGNTGEETLTWQWDEA